MTNLTNLSTTQLHRIIAIKERIEALQGQIESIAGGGGEIPVPLAGAKLPKKKRPMSRAGRAAIAAAARARWG